MMMMSLVELSAALHVGQRQSRKELCFLIMNISEDRIYEFIFKSDGVVL